MTKKFEFTIQTNLINSGCSEIVELEFHDDATQEMIEAVVTQLYVEWLFENNTGGFNEVEQ